MIPALTAPLAALGRHGPLLLAATMVAGIALPDLATALRPALGPFVALLMLVSLLRLDWAELGRWLARPGPGLWALFWQLCVLPLLAFLLMIGLGLPDAYGQALVLNAVAPSLMGSAALAQLIGLDAALAVVLIVASTLLLPITLPIVLFWLLELEFSFDYIAFGFRVGYLIVLPFLVAWFVRRHLPDAALLTARPQLDGLNVLLLVLAGLALMDGVTARLLIDPVAVGGWFVLGLAFNITAQAVGALVFWRGGRQRALSVALALGNRNMGLVLVLTAGFVGPDFALYVAMAQIPMYLLPLLARPIYRRLL